jgi:hypothetical protein
MTKASLKGAMSWLGIDKNSRTLLPTLLPRIATDIQPTDTSVGPTACNLGKCYTMSQRNIHDHDNLDEIVSTLHDIDIEALVKAFEALKEENWLTYIDVMDTPHVFLENVGIRRAVLIVKAMEKYVCLYQTVDILQNGWCREQNFATFCYIAAKALSIYNSNTQSDVEQVANYICTLIKWDIPDRIQNIIYPEITGGDLNAKQGTKCYRRLTTGQAFTILNRINGHALYKSTMFSDELLDSLTVSDSNDKSPIVCFNENPWALYVSGDNYLTYYYMVVIHDEVILKKNQPRNRT